MWEDQSMEQPVAPDIAQFRSACRPKALREDVGGLDESMEQPIAPDIAQTCETCHPLTCISAQGPLSRWRAV